VLSTPLCILNSVSVIYRLKKPRNNCREVIALDSISLEIQKGQRIGLIGLNGAGKTTLLKVISGVLPCTTGSVALSGRIVPILNSNLGLDLRLSGSENAMARLMLVGLDRKRAKEVTDQLSDWTELGSRMLDPIATYSAGMRARLAFALNTEISSDLLVIDEGISAGDYEFQDKARERLKMFMSKASTLLIASHSLSYLNDFTSQMILLEKGKIVAQGQNKEIFELYSSRAIKKASQENEI
jgi:ABC-2 type transport system ATP-binding protein